MTGHFSSYPVTEEAHEKEWWKLNPKDFWEYYHEGKVVRRHDTPLSVISTMEDWLDGKRTSTMLRFIRGEPVAPKNLRREIERCVHENSLTKEIKRLGELEVWAIREAALAEAAKNLREAEKDLYQAARDAGLDAYHTYKIATGPSS